MSITMVVPLRPPHVDSLVRKPNKTEADRKLLSLYGKRGNISRTRKERAVLKDREPFKKVNLDPEWEFPLHDVLYRGARFWLLEPLRSPSKAARHHAAVLEYLRDKVNYVEECRRRDEQANLHICPIDD